MDEEEAIEGLDEDGNYDEQLEQLSLRYAIPNALGAMSRMSQSTTEARARLKEARERILSREYSNALPLLAASAALGAPTQAGSFAESFGNMSGAIGSSVKDKMAFTRQKDEDLLGVDTAMLGMDKTSLEAAIKLAQLRQKMQDPASWRLYKKYLKEVAPKGEDAKAEFFEVLRNPQLEIEDVNLGKQVVDLSNRRPTRELSTTATEVAAAGQKSEAQQEGSAIGAASALAKENLPEIEASTNQLVGLLDTMVVHPGMKMRVGATSYIPVLAGTDAANFDALWKQVGGKQFLKAYETLKGTGQITVIEGEQGKEAIARVQNAQDEKEFKKAVGEFKAHVLALAARARARAAAAPQTEAQKALTAIPRIKDDADFDKLPRGAVFIDPDGNQRTKP
jgi:hypothetical protein